MHQTLISLANSVVNDDLSALCGYLAFFEVGDVIDEAEAARVLQLDVNTVVFLLDTLVELGALIGPAPLGEVRLELAA